MQHCEYMESCFYHQSLGASDSATAGFMRIRYCQGGPETCARFIAARRVGPEMVPTDLHPTDSEKIQVFE